MKCTAKIIILLALLLQCGRYYAQSDKDKVEALRVSFISKKLEFTTSESEKFWPVYNEYNDKLKSVKRNVRQNFHRRGENASDKEAEELYQLDLQSKQAENDLYRQYSEKLKAIIGAKKMVKLRIAEEEFRRTILETIKGKGD